MKGVVNCKTDKYDVLIDRTTKWGNPYKDGTRKENIQNYEWLLLRQVKSGEITMEELASLADQVLGCHCAPRPCHGNILKSYAIQARNLIKITGEIPTACTLQSQK